MYEDYVLKALLTASHPMSVVVDTQWKSYWEARFERPLDDAESLQINPEGYITDIGQRITDIKQPDAQYIGLMKFKGEGVDVLKQQMKVLSTKKDFDKMYMTDFLQTILRNHEKIHAVPIARKWIEIDSIKDYKLAQEIVKLGVSGPQILK